MVIAGARDMPSGGLESGQTEGSSNSSRHAPA